jgi:hypothetical protein
MTSDEFRAKAASDPLGDRERDLVAAWRATLGAAAAVADRTARECERAAGGSGHLASVLLKGLGDELFAMRDRDPRELDPTMAGLLGAPWPPVAVDAPAEARQGAEEGRSGAGAGSGTLAPDIPPQSPPDRPSVDCASGANSALPHFYRTAGGHAATTPPDPGEPENQP